MTVLTFVLGLFVGLLLKGIHIHIHKEEKSVTPTKYHESLAAYLPNEVQSYYNETGGYNKF